MIKSKTILNLLIPLLLLLSSCNSDLRNIQSQKSFENQWLYEDLAVIDPVDAPSPESDLIAAYVRSSAHFLELRLDYLAADPLGHYQTTIYIEPNSINQVPPLNEPSQWDYKIEIGSLQPSEIIDISSSAVLEQIVISRSSDQDFLVIPVSLEVIQKDLKDALFFCTVTDPENGIILDQLGPFTFQPTNPPARSPLLISFWNVFESTSPAQSLRSWNGAHTGPFGSRHGLYYLLDAVSRFQIPVALVDLVEPSKLYALNYLNILDSIRNDQENGLLILPDTAYGFSAEKALEKNRNIFRSYEFPDNSILYGTFNWNNIPQESFIFAVTEIANLPQHSDNGVKIIPLPLSYRDGSVPMSNLASPRETYQFPLWLKEELIKTALSDRLDDFVNIGESFPASALGDPEVSKRFFSYISNHPWIKAVSREDLLFLFQNTQEVSRSDECQDVLCTPSLPDAWPHSLYGTIHPEALSYPDMVNQTTKSLSDLPDNDISAMAWQMYQRYLSPGKGEKQHILQANYIGQVGHLIQAAEWMEAPSDIHECFDMDWDGIPECILSNDRFFSSYEIDGGRLLYLFLNNGCGAIPVISPFSQYSTGISDPGLWNINHGYLSDPGEISGFLPDGLDNPGNYQSEITERTIKFEDRNLNISKIFTLEKNTLSIEVNYPEKTTVLFPLATDFVLESNSPGNFRLITKSNLPEAAEKACLEINIPGQLPEASSYKDSEVMLNLPENPDQDYPDGHYLPFPFQVLKFSLIHSQKILLTSLN